MQVKELLKFWKNICSKNIKKERAYADKIGVK